MHACSCCSYGQVEACQELVRLGSPVMLIIIAHFLLNLQVTGMAELFPLFCARVATRNATTAELLYPLELFALNVSDVTNAATGDSAASHAVPSASTHMIDNGGLGLSPSEVGRALVPLGLTLWLTPLLYPHLERRCGGHVGCLCTGFLTLTAACLLLPFLRAFRDVSIEALWSGLILVGILRGLSGPLVFCAVSVILNDLIAKRPGFYNGLALSASSLARALAPTATGSLFAAMTAVGASSTARPFPLDYHLPFFLLAAVGLLTVGLVRHVAGTSKPRAARGCMASCRRWRSRRWQRFD